MKKSLLALGAACIALSGIAAAPLQKFEAPVKKSFQKLPELKSYKDSMVKKTPAKIGSPDDIITSVQGTTQEMSVTSSGYLVYFDYVLPYFDEPSATKVVYGDNNEVYLYEVVPFAVTDSYVKGIKNGDKIEVSLPQTVEFNEYYGYGLNLCLLEKAVEDDGEGGELVWFYPTDDTTVTFTIAADGSITADGLSEDLELGYAWTDDNTWGYFAVSSLTMTPFNEKPVTVPDDVEVSENFWSFDAGDYSWPVNWAQGYDEFYFQGLAPSLPDLWVKATVDYDDDAAIVSVPQNQYLGVYGGQFVYTKFAKLSFDEYGNVTDADMMPDDYQYQLIWDYEENTMVAKDSDVSFIYNGGDAGISYFEILPQVKLVHQDDFAGTPANPSNLYFEDTYASDGYGTFRFDVPAVSTDGDFLNTDDLSYVVYVDGEEWEFDADDYELDANMVEIPWDFSVYYIYNWGGTVREVDFFVEGITTLGVQSVYKYNGEETRSEIVTLDLDDPTAVAGLNADKKVASVKLYDVAGREVSSAAKGIVIKRVVYEDGSVASFKKAVR